MIDDLFDSKKEIITSPNIGVNDTFDDVLPRTVEDYSAIVIYNTESKLIINDEVNMLTTFVEELKNVDPKIHKFNKEQFNNILDSINTNVNFDQDFIGLIVSKETGILPLHPHVLSSFSAIENALYAYRLLDKGEANGDITFDDFEKRMLFLDNFMTLSDLSKKANTIEEYFISNFSIIKERL